MQPLMSHPIVLSADAALDIDETVEYYNPFYYRRGQPGYYSTGF
jgi:hypothetical protein